MEGRCARRCAAKRRPRLRAQLPAPRRREPCTGRHTYVRAGRQPRRAGATGGRDRQTGASCAGTFRIGRSEPSPVMTSWIPSHLPPSELRARRPRCRAMAPLRHSPPVPPLPPPPPPDPHLPATPVRPRLLLPPSPRVSRLLPAPPRPLLFSRHPASPEAPPGPPPPPAPRHAVRHGRRHQLRLQQRPPAAGRRQRRQPRRRARGAFRPDMCPPAVGGAGPGPAWLAMPPDAG